jgi:signal transduction histidine kinase
LNRLAECLASGDGLENPSGLTVGEAVYVLGPVDQFTNSYAGFRVDVVGIRRLVAEAARAEAEPRGVSLLAEGPSRNAGSMTGAALQAPMRWLVEEYMPSPFASVKLLAFATPSSELGSSGVLRMQLYVWGVFLLAVGVVIGSWLVVSIAAAEIRHARAGSDFVASVSHELRTPLASMKMLTESLYLGNVTDEQTKKKFLETMLKEYERLWHLIEGVLFVVRTGQGASRYRLREEDLGDLVRSAVDSFVRSLRDETVNITVDMPRHVLYALVDAVAMEQVLLNLLDNAVKYSRASKEIRVTVGPINNGRHIEVAVHDRGIGLEKRDLRKVFRKFYRVQGPQTAEVPGVGLGLALCRHIVKAHRGRIEVESRVGVGSTFRVILPSLKREPHEMP